MRRSLKLAAVEPVDDQLELIRYDHSAKSYAKRTPETAGYHQRCTLARGKNTESGNNEKRARFESSGRNNHRHPGTLPRSCPLWQSHRIGLPMERASQQTK